MTGQAHPTHRPAILRLSRLAPVGGEALAALDQAASRPQPLAAHRELIAEGEPIPEPLLLLEGWAARARTFIDGRRQIMNFFLPGEVIGLSDQERPGASASIIGCTPCVLCRIPSRGTSAGLDRAYATCRAQDEAHLLAQIARIGRLDAYDRLLDLLLELMERLELAGLSDRGRFVLPVTQEQIADSLGLTSVHVNRMIQQARRAGQLELQARTVTIRDPEALSTQLGRRRTLFSSHG